MNVTYHTDKDLLYIELEGRVDTSNATAVDEQIAKARKENGEKHTVIDADRLEYISSAGLRVILKLRKEDPKLAIINVSPEVYEILDMTGFTDMVTVEKAFRKMSVEGCEFIAKGANGAVYRYDDETIVKVYFVKDALPDIQKERENARRAFVLGVNTAIPYGVVRVGDGYGLVTELLTAMSITKMIRQSPNDLEEAANHYVNMLRTIHQTKDDSGVLSDMKQTGVEWAAFVAPYLPKEKAQKLQDLFEAIPKSQSLLHGDYNTNNVMIQNGDPILIDMDTLCLGHPVFELGSMFNAFLGFSSVNHKEIENFMGYDRKTSESFWRLTLKKYLGTEDEALCNEIEKKAMIVGYTRLLRRAVRRPNAADSAAMIEHCKSELNKLLEEVDSLVF